MGSNGHPCVGRLRQVQYLRNPARCQAMPPRQPEPGQASEELVMAHENEVSKIYYRGYAAQERAARRCRLVLYGKGDPPDLFHESEHDLQELPSRF